MGVALDEPPVGYRLQNPQDAKPVMAALLNGAGATLSGESLGEIKLPEGDDVEISVTETPLDGNETRLVYHPQRFALGLGCARNADPEAMWQHIEKTLADNQIAKGAIACGARLI